MQEDRKRPKRGKEEARKRGKEKRKGREESEKKERGENEKRRMKERGKKEKRYRKGNEEKVFGLGLLFEQMGRARVGGSIRNCIYVQYCTIPISSSIHTAGMGFYMSVDLYKSV